MGRTDYWFFSFYAILTSVLVLLISQIVLDNEIAKSNKPEPFIMIIANNQSHEILEETYNIVIVKEGKIIFRQMSNKQTTSVIEESL